MPDLLFVDPYIIHQTQAPEQRPENNNTHTDARARARAHTRCTHQPHHINSQWPERNPGEKHVQNVYIWACLSGLLPNDQESVCLTEEGERFCFPKCSNFLKLKKKIKRPEGRKEKLKILPR